MYSQFFHLKFVKIICFISFLLAIPLFAQQGWRDIKPPTQPTYSPRTNPGFQKMGRFVGNVKYAPKEYTITFIKQSAKKINIKKEDKGISIKITGEISVFESPRLSPGFYTIDIQADGYKGIPFMDYQIKPKNDAHITLEFGTTEYRNP